MSWHRQGLYIVMTGALIAVIAWGALRDVPPIPKMFQGQDKLEHFLAFGALMFWLTAFLRPSRWMLALGLSVCGAFVLEVGQAILTTARSADMFDFAASCLGVIAAASFILFVRKAMRSSPVS